MEKLRLKIDADIKIRRLVVTVEAFGYEAVVGVHRKMVSGQARPKLAKEEFIELTPDDYSDDTSEKSKMSDQ